MALTPVEYTNKANNISSELDNLYSEINLLPNEKHLNFVTAGTAQILAGYVGADKNGMPVNGEYVPTPTVTSIPTSSWETGTGTNGGILKIPFEVDADIYVAGGSLSCYSGSSSVKESFSYLYIPDKGVHALEVYGYYGGTTSTKSFDASTQTATVSFLSKITQVTSVKTGYAYAIKF